MDQVILLVFILSTQSSYTHDGEYPATPENYDTIQWWLDKDRAFRVSTFAKTNDIHIYEISKAVSPSMAFENTNKHYGDIISGSYALEISDTSDLVALKSLVMDKLGRGDIELIPRLNAGFWNFDGRLYTTQTDP